jgi:flagellar basal-body rod protein FlgC
MSFLPSLDISASGLTAQRLRMDVISENIANIDTTRTATGGPYRRRYVIFQQQADKPFSQYLDDSMNSAAGQGVYVSQIADDQSPFTLKYDPTNPDANADGYVQMPNVDLTTEMVDMMSATRSYEADVTAVNATKNMAMTALDIGK